MVCAVAETVSPDTTASLPASMLTLPVALIVTSAALFSVIPPLASSTELPCWSVSLIDLGVIVEHRGIAPRRGEGEPLLLVVELELDLLGVRMVLRWFFSLAAAGWASSSCAGCRAPPRSSGRRRRSRRSPRRRSPAGTSRRRPCCSRVRRAAPRARSSPGRPWASSHPDHALAVRDPRSASPPCRSAVPRRRPRSGGSDRPRRVEARAPPRSAIAVLDAVRDAADEPLRRRSGRRGRRAPASRRAGRGRCPGKPPARASARAGRGSAAPWPWPSSRPLARAVAPSIASGRPPTAARSPGVRLPDAALLGRGASRSSAAWVPMSQPEAVTEANWLRASISPSKLIRSWP